MARRAAERAHAGHVMALVVRFMPQVFVQTLGEDALRTIAIFDASNVTISNASGCNEAYYFPLCAEGGSYTMGDGSMQTFTDVEEEEVC